MNLMPAASAPPPPSPAAATPGAAAGTTAGFPFGSLLEMLAQELSPAELAHVTATGPGQPDAAAAPPAPAAWPALAALAAPLAAPAMTEAATADTPASEPGEPSTAATAAGTHLIASTPALASPPDMPAPPAPVLTPAPVPAPVPVPAPPADIATRPATDGRTAAPAAAPIRPAAGEHDAALTPKPPARTILAPAASQPPVPATIPAATMPAIEPAPATEASAPPASVRPQALAHVLGDRLQLQLSQGVERAVIRLDPPSLGSIEIRIRHEAGSLQVHLSASHADVLRQLHLVSDSLRQDPVLRQFSEVSVSIGSKGDEGGERRQPQRQAQEAAGPGLALAEADDGPFRTPFGLDLR